MATTTRKPEKLRASVAFTAEVDGADVLVHKGDVVRASHKVVKGREQLFEPAAADAVVDHE
jgi:hypothetical protein